MTIVMKKVHVVGNNPVAEARCRLMTFFIKIPDVMPLAIGLNLTGAARYGDFFVQKKDLSMHERSFSSSLAIN